MQVDILGLLVYYLAVEKNYQFIFGGDFNSHIFVGEKDKK